MLAVRFGDVHPGISARTLNRYGEVIYLEKELEAKGAGKSFCDGQTSATPPEHAYDKDGMFLFDDKKTADDFSRALRESLEDLIPEGTDGPVWLNEPRKQFDVAPLLLFMASTYAVTDSQSDTAINAAINYFGYLPDEEELGDWVKENRDFDLSE
jgi:hypothetical protein